MLQIQINAERFLAELPVRLQSSVVNTAQSEIGFPYYAAVDRGRRAVRPVNAKALRIPTPNGFIFRKFAGPSAPRHITKRSLEDILPNAQFSAAFAAGQTIRGWITSFLNSMAKLHSDSLATRTPIRTGNLAGSYEVRKAD